MSGGEQDPSAFNSNPNLNVAKSLRAAGQFVFLAINAFLLYCVVDSMRSDRRQSIVLKSVHPTLYILLATWPLLLVRGIYGFLSAIVPTFNYFDPANYTADGLKDSFVISEYVMSTTMEWTSCVLLLMTYFASKHDPQEWRRKTKDEMALTGVESSLEEGVSSGKKTVSL